MAFLLCVLVALVAALNSYEHDASLTGTDVRKGTASFAVWMPVGSENLNRFD